MAGRYTTVRRHLTSAAVLVALMVMAPSCSSGSSGSSGSAVAPGTVAPGTVTTEMPDGPDTGSGATTDWDLDAFEGLDIWVDPIGGDDAADGATRATALRTVGAAWQRIPADETLSEGRRIMLAPGTYPVEGSVNYWENRRGTAEAPIIVMAADGPHRQPSTPT